MTSAARPIPEGYQTITPYLTVEDSGKLMEFLKKAFGATVAYRIDDETGMPSHAELKIGTSMLMLGRARGEWKPQTCAIYLYVPDVDATYKNAIDAGAKSVQEVMDQFYGDRSGGVQDPSGNFWWIATHIEDVPSEEITRRHQEWMKKNAKKS